MSKKKKTLVAILAILIAAVLLIVIGIRSKQINNVSNRLDIEEQKAFIKMQKPAANELYQNYRLYATDTKKIKDLEEKYHKGQGSLSRDEYLKQKLMLREYFDIKTIKFTMVDNKIARGVNVYFTINNVYEGKVFLYSKDYGSVETSLYDTNEWTYKFELGKESYGYTLDKKDNPTTEPIPKDQVAYYIGENLEDEFGLR